jgi:hypothetical protein
MARSENAVPTTVVKVSTTEQICALLDQLIGTGMFGKTRAEVAERLLSEKLREIRLQGWGDESNVPLPTTSIKTPEISQ